MYGCVLGCAAKTYVDRARCECELADMATTYAGAVTQQLLAAALDTRSRRLLVAVDSLAAFEVALELSHWPVVPRLLIRRLSAGPLLQLLPYRHFLVEIAQTRPAIERLLRPDLAVGQPLPR